MWELLLLGHVGAGTRGQSRGGERQSFSYRLLLDGVQVTGPGGEPFQSSNTRDRRHQRLKIRVPGATGATREVVIHYQFHNALRCWQDFDELYRNVTGEQWEMPIRHASVMMVLPGGVTRTRTGSWTDGYGCRQDAASVHKIEDGFYLETTRGLSAHSMGHLSSVAPSALTSGPRSAGGSGFGSGRLGDGFGGGGGGRW